MNVRKLLYVFILFAIIICINNSNVKAFGFTYQDTAYTFPDLPADGNLFNSEAFLIIKTSGNFNLNSEGFTLVTFLDYDESTDFVHQGDSSVGGYFYNSNGVENSNTKLLRIWEIDNLSDTTWEMTTWQPNYDYSNNDRLKNYDNLIYSTVDIYTDISKSEIFFPRSAPAEPDSGGETGGNEDDTPGDTPYPTYDFSSTGVLSWITQGFSDVVGAIEESLNNITMLFSGLFTRLDVMLVNFEDILMYLEELTEGGEDYNDFKDERGDYEDGDTSGQIGGAAGEVQDSFDFYEDIKANVEDMIEVITDTSSAPSYSVHISSWVYTGNVKVLDLSWYAPYRETGNTIICIFAYCSFLWHVFIKLPEIIQGGGASTFAGNMVSDIEAYRVTGFGRSRSPHDRGF